MPRPHKCRSIRGLPTARGFKPTGAPGRELKEVVLRLDELEALRLADLEGLYHQAAAESMRVSRATFGRLLDEARRKVADALIHGKLLTMQGGVIEMQRNDERVFQCHACNQSFSVPRGTGRPSACPSCGGANLSRDPSDRGGRGGRGGGCGQGGRRRNRGGRGNPAGPTQAGGGARQG
jgi:predicted DNA-binding protein (UPF0251 family)